MRKRATLCYAPLLCTIPLFFLVGGGPKMASVDRSWIEVQQSTFTNWCNDHLKGAETKIDDLETDLDDGVRLVILLEQLAMKKVSKK